LANAFLSSRLGAPTAMAEQSTLPDYYETAYESERDPNAPLEPRNFGAVDFVRLMIECVAMAVIFACWYLVLPVIQKFFLPSVQIGNDGPWLIRPSIVFRINAAIFATCVTLPLLLMQLRAEWKAQDRAMGTKWDRYHDRPLRKLIVIAFCVYLWVAYCAYFFGYLFSSTVISSTGIEQRTILARHDYTFDQISWLEAIPAGMRSATPRHDGPWYKIEFTDGRSVIFDSTEEGISNAKLAEIAKLIVKQSGKSWHVPADTRRR
jgi:hypothetical protein